jgi:hypothetical protein
VREILGQKELIGSVFDDWINGNSISHNPLIYIDQVVLS